MNRISTIPPGFLLPANLPPQRARTAHPFTSRSPAPGRSALPGLRRTEIHPQGEDAAFQRGGGVAKVLAAGAAAAKAAAQGRASLEAVVPLSRLDSPPAPLVTDRVTSVGASVLGGEPGPWLPASVLGLLMLARWRTGCSRARSYAPSAGSGCPRPPPIARNASPSTTDERSDATVSCPPSSAPSRSPSTSAGRTGCSPNPNDWPKGSNTPPAPPPAANGPTPGASCTTDDPGPEAEAPTSPTRSRCATNTTTGSTTPATTTSSCPTAASVQQTDMRSRTVRIDDRGQRPSCDRKRAQASRIAARCDASTVVQQTLVTSAPEPIDDQGQLVIAGLGSVERVTTTPPAITNLGQLRASGHQQKSLREEMRANLLDALREGRDPWPGLHGFEATVIPQLERAILAGHDVVLLGERGQGKTRLLRTLVGLLDEWTPVIAGSELGEHPYEPIIHESKRRALAGGRRPGSCLAAPRRAVRREAGHPGHERRRPDR